MRTHQSSFEETQSLPNMRARYFNSFVGNRDNWREPQRLTAPAQFLLFDNLQEGIAVIDYNLRVRYWNDALGQLVAVPQFAELGQNIFAVLPPAFENFLRPSIDKVIKNSGNVSNVCTLGASQSKRRVYRYRISQQKPAWIVISLVDITDSYRLDREKDQREYLENWGILSVGVTQELIQPLDEIYQITRDLHVNKKIADQAQVQKQLDHIEQRIYQISYLVHNLVGLSQDTVPHFSEVDIATLIDELEQTWDVSGDKQPRFAISKTPDLPKVTGNRVLLSSVLYNLMRIMSTLSGPDAVPRIQTTFLKEENKVAVSIANGKPKLSDAEIEQLLDLFYRGTKISPGTGLALFISKRVIELHGCSLEIRNDEQLGTVFEMQLQAGQSLSV